MYRKHNREQISVDDFIPPFGGKLSSDNCRGSEQLWCYHLLHAIRTTGLVQAD
ncbi:MAG TPA: hypothetical protein PKJ47_09880 [Candidatus Limiplasma sp.]|nr:hypothetical protein [Candidatus Limiplasma sp.]